MTREHQPLTVGAHDVRARFTGRKSVEAIESRDPRFSPAFPSRTVPNPFLPDQIVQDGTRTLSIQNRLLNVCLLQEEDLTLKSTESVREKITGSFFV